MNTLVSIGFLLFHSFMRTESVPTTHWTCAPMQWAAPLSYSGSILRGSLSVECKLNGMSGKGLGHLYGVLISETPSLVNYVHSGPTPTTYKDLPGTYYDITLVDGNGSATIRTRQDVYMATDGKNILVHDAFSKAMNNTGDAKYLRKMDSTATLQPATQATETSSETNTENAYTLKIFSTVEFVKPFIIFPGMFRDLIQKGIEQNITAVEQRYAEQYVPYL